MATGSQSFTCVVEPLTFRVLSAVTAEERAGTAGGKQKGGFPPLGGVMCGAGGGGGVVLAIHISVD